MNNILKIKRGLNKPNDGILEDGGLGFIKSNNTLCIGKLKTDTETGVEKILPITTPIQIEAKNIIDVLPTDSKILQNIIIDNLNSTSTIKPLSANMGKYLNDNKLNITGGLINGNLQVGGTIDSIRVEGEAHIGVDDTESNLYLWTRKSDSNRGIYDNNVGNVIRIKGVNNVPLHYGEFTRDETVTLIPEYSNEINFGGTNGSPTIFMGYRAEGSRPIPTDFIFGGSNGSANIQCNYVKSNWLKTTASINLGSAADRIAVLSSDGYIYNRTPSELLNDMGVYGSIKGNESGPSYMRIGKLLICWGYDTITPSAAYTSSLQDVFFPVSFTIAPTVLVSIKGRPEINTLTLSHATTSTTGFQANIFASNTTRRGFEWIAIGY